MTVPRRGVFPGSFDPPTTAHLAIAEAARHRHGLDSIDLAISRVALVKRTPDAAAFDERVRVLGLIAQRIAWLGVVVTDDQLVADIAAGYDVVIMGADKWAQVNDPAFYGGDPHARDLAVGHLPTVAIAPRPPWEAPDEFRLEVDPIHRLTSSSRARAGEVHLMVEEAARHDRETREWTGRQPS